MKTTRKLIEALMTASLTMTLQAQIAQSTFDSGSDGWIVVDRVNNSLRVSGTRQPSFIASGGNPGGFVRTADNSSNYSLDFYWRAPGKFLGDKSAAYGGRLDFDVRSNDADSYIPYSVVLIGGGVTNVGPILYFTQANTWKHFSYPLVAGAVLTNYIPAVTLATWTNVTTHLPSTEYDLRAALEDLQVLDIAGEYGYGADTGDLDNVALVAGSTCPTAMIRVSEVEICWLSASNAIYQIDFRSDLTTNTWVPLFTNIQGSGEEMCVYDEIGRGVPQRFYRVTCPGQ